MRAGGARSGRKPGQGCTAQCTNAAVEASTGQEARRSLLPRGLLLDRIAASQPPSSQAPSSPQRPRSATPQLPSPPRWTRLAHPLAPFSFQTFCLLPSAAPDLSCGSCAGWRKFEHCLVRRKGLARRPLARAAKALSRRLRTLRALRHAASRRRVAQHR